MEKVIKKTEIFHIPRLLTRAIPDDVIIETDEDVLVEIKEVPDGCKPKLTIIIKKIFRGIKN